MLIQKNLLSLIFTLSLMGSLAPSASHSQEDEAGKKLYQGCIECHGADGMGSKEQGTPKVAGQFDWYILSQLKAFKAKTRHNPKTLAAISGFNDKELNEVATYISKMKAVQPDSK